MMSLHILDEYQEYLYELLSSVTGADPGGPGGPGPPLTLGFEAPKLSIFGPYLIFP